MKLKYPSERRPTLVYSNESGGINVTLNLTKNKATQELMEPYLDNFMNTFKNMYPSAEWKDSGKNVINGKKVGFLKLVTPAIDTNIYNVMVFADLNGQLLLCSFNCTEKSIKKWMKKADKLNSKISWE